MVVIMGHWLVRSAGDGCEQLNSTRDDDDVRCITGLNRREIEHHKDRCIEIVTGFFSSVSGANAQRQRMPADQSLT